MPTTYFGNAVAGTVRAFPANTAEAETFQCTADGSITTSRYRLSGGGAGATHVIATVYASQQLADADPTGFALLGKSDPITVGSADAAADIDLPFSVSVPVVAGTWYALGILADNAINAFGGGNGGYFNGPDTYSDGPAATFPAGGSASGVDRKLTFQAGVTSAGGGGGGGGALAWVRRKLRRRGR